MTNSWINIIRDKKKSCNGSISGVNGFGRLQIVSRIEGEVIPFGIYTGKSYPYGADSYEEKAYYGHSWA